MSQQWHLSLSVIALVCVFGAAVRKWRAPQSMTTSEVAVYAVVLAFMGLCLVMIMNAVGLDWGYWDEVLASTALAFLHPPRNLVRHERRMNTNWIIGYIVCPHCGIRVALPECAQLESRSTRAFVFGTSAVWLCRECGGHFRPNQRSLLAWVAKSVSLLLVYAFVETTGSSLAGLFGVVALVAIGYSYRRIRYEPAP